MTQVQIASIGTATVAIGVSGSPYIMVENVMPQGSSTLVPFAYSYQKLVRLIDAGYVLLDPDAIVTCHCGAMKAAWQDECGACRREALDAKDDGQMCSDLRGGL